MENANKTECEKQQSKKETQKHRDEFISHELYTIHEELLQHCDDEDANDNKDTQRIREEVIDDMSILKQQLDYCCTKPNKGNVHQNIMIVFSSVKRSIFRFKNKTLNNSLGF